MFKRILKNKKVVTGILISAPFFVLIGLAGFYGLKYSADESVGVGVSLPGSITGGQSYLYSEYVRGLYAFSMKVAVALCTLMVIYAGYKYLTSRGESGAINEAKDILFSTLMGAALLILVILVGEISGFNTTTWGI
jgi:hypothetical protein